MGLIKNCVCAELDHGVTFLPLYGDTEFIYTLIILFYGEFFNSFFFLFFVPPDFFSGGLSGSVGVQNIFLP